MVRLLSAYLAPNCVVVTSVILFWVLSAQTVTAPNGMLTPKLVVEPVPTPTMLCEVSLGLMWARAATAAWCLS